MQVLAINGSHRPGKNTAIMLNLVLEEIKTGGFSTELIELSECNIKLCKACNKCLMKTECAIKDDDMSLLGKKMLESDAVILGSPVYFSNVTGLFKTFIDRSRWMHMCKNLLDGKIGAALTHAGLRNGGQEFTQNILERFLQAHGLHVIEARDPNAGVYNLGPLGAMFNSFDGDNIRWHKDVTKDTLAVYTCRSLGRNILKALKNRG